ncbi:MAG: alpha-L-Rha alpha-1,3-L-rhamnosyltransferase [Betaproteobacteria bacterium HGW-Betaproteobacteria-13]|jgi:glycosyltransferase involved in cell wall biosynthesis|nr:MAG: alpha-L-Rha alpha-1,3-L-rhamnosyltransferase [Betaproteobacteria bacterium HGW-Betaproteobacteria-13]
MISVCMATYNGQRYVADQIKSVLPQLAPDDELVIADDASSDGTLAVIKGFDDPRICVLASEVRLGVVPTFERALSAARGEIVFLCDQDDVWLPNKRAVFLEALAVADLVVSDCRVTDADLNERASSFFSLRASGPGLLRNLWRNGFLGCCMAFRRSLLQRALPFPTGLPMHDTWLGLVASTTGRVRFVPEVTLLYRRHGGNASPTGELSHFSRFAQLSHRLRFAFALLIRLALLRLRPCGNQG